MLNGDSLRRGFLFIIFAVQSERNGACGMNLDCRVLSTACPRVFEECRDEIRHGLSTEKATKGKVKRSGRKTPKTLVVGVCLAVKIYIDEAV